MTDRTHGGRREGAGRPRTTLAPLIPGTIRLTAEEWAALRAEAKAYGITTGRLIALALECLPRRSATDTGKE